jgi:RNA polymerase sigma factor (sigma-70 family)
MYQNGKNITFTDRSNSSVDMFLKDIKKSQPLTNEQEYDLWTLMRQGNKRARDKFIKANLRYVVTVAKKYLASGTALEDLIMAGSLGITKAADMFDATLGYRFISFATWYVESEVRKAAYDHLKLKCDTVSLDEPMYPDKDDSDAMIDYLPSSMEVAADWNVRYDDTLAVLKSGLDKQYWQGTGEMLDDYLSMMEKGLTTFDFARKYRLNDQQMRRFLDMVRTESRHYLKAAA